MNIKIVSLYCLKPLIWARNCFLSLSLNTFKTSYLLLLVYLFVQIYLLLSSPSLEESSVAQSAKIFRHDLQPSGIAFKLIAWLETISHVNKDWAVLGGAFISLVLIGPLSLATYAIIKLHIKMKIGADKTVQLKQRIKALKEAQELEKNIVLSGAGQKKKKIAKI